MADGSLTIVAQPNLLLHNCIFCEMQAGQTIAQILGSGASYACEVSLDGYPVPRDLWGKVRPKAGKIMHVTLYPQGGGNGAKYLRIVAMAALTYFTIGAGATWAGGLSTTTGLSTATIYGAAFIVGSLAINALIPPPMPKGLGGVSGDPFQQLNSLTGTSNETSPYDVIPCVVGTKRFFPPHAALPYTEISGDDQYLRMLLDLGHGDLDVSDIRIGSYTDVEWDIGTMPSLFTQDFYELSVSSALVNAGDTKARVRVRFPDGGRLAKTGSGSPTTG